jgi:hypothetical protein
MQNQYIVSLKRRKTFMKDIRSTFFSMVFASLVCSAGAALPASAQQQEKRSDSTDYTLIRKSPGIKEVDFKRGKKKGSGLVITFGEKVTDLKSNNITAGNVTGNTKSAERLNEKGPEFDRIDIIEGKYGDIAVEKKTSTQNIYTLTNLTFPLRLVLHSGTDFVEFRLAEAAKWALDVNYKK